MKNNIIILVVFLFPIISCQHVDYVAIDSKSDNCKVLELDPVFEQYDFAIADVVDTMKVIALETNSESIISRIRFMKMLGEYIYIYDNYQDGNIAIFDVNGKFIRRLAYGNGPGEVYVYTFDVNEHYLYTYQYEKVNKYTLAGEFIESYPVLEMYNKIFHSIKAVDDGFLLSVYPCNSQSHKYEIFYTDKDFKLKNVFVFDHSVVGYGLSNDFKVLHNEIVFFPPMINTVYFFDGELFKPLYELNYPKNANLFKSNPDCSGSGLDFFRKHCISRKFFPEGKIYQSHNIIFFTFLDFGEITHVYLDTKSGNFRSGVSHLSSDTPVWPLKYGVVECTYNDYFVQTLTPADYLTVRSGLHYDVEGNHLEESVSQLRHISDEDKKKILNAKDDDNPLIIMYKLKSIE